MGAEGTPPGVMSGATPRRNRVLAGCALLLLLALGWTPLSRAEEGVLVEDPRIEEVDDVVMLSARIRYQLSDEVLEALNSGVPLFFVVDIEVVKVRRWWPDATVAALQQRYLLLYHALSEKYVVHNLNSGVQGNYGSLTTALWSMGRVERLPVIDRGLLSPGSNYLVRLRAALDLDALPAPIQPLAHLSADWRLESPWYELSLAP